MPSLVDFDPDSNRTVGLVAPAESNVRVVDGNEAVVRDGDAVSIARQIGEHLFGAGERPLGVDDPLHSPQRHRGSERLGIGEWSQIIEELQLAGTVDSTETIQEQAPVVAGEHAHR